MTAEAAEPARAKKPPRPKGKASQRKDGRWVTSLRLADGRRQYLYGASQRDVLRKLAAARKLVAEGEVPPDRRTLEDYLSDWLESSAGRVKPNTYRRYEQLCRLYVVPAIGKSPLAQVRPEQIQRLYVELERKGLAPASVRHVHALLHHALKRAYRWRLVRENVADLVDAPRVGRYEAATLTAAQARALLRAVAGDPLEAVYVLALHAGMRQGEILGLRWQDVDLAAGRLTVRGALDRRGEWSETKTRASRHAVLLTRGAQAALTARKEAQASQWSMLEKVPAAGDLVFTDAAGGPVSQWALRRDHYRALAAAGLPRVRFHDLRHTAATLLLEEGVQPKVVADLLGHSTPTLTMGTYSHVTATLQQSAIDALDRLFPSDGGQDRGQTPRAPRPGEEKTA